jgi:catalase
MSLREFPARWTDADAGTEGQGEEAGPRECPATGFTTFEGHADHDEEGGKLRVRAELFADHYSQARLLFHSLTENEQAHVASSFTFELSKVALEHVPPRMVANLRNVDEGLAKRVAAGIGIPLPPKTKAAREPMDMKPSPALSIQRNMRETIEGRAIGILYADGSDGKAIKSLVDAIKKAGGTPKLISPKVGGATLADGSKLKADGQLAGTPSQTVDAIAVVLSAEGCKALLKEAAAVQFVMDAFGHLKAIGHTPDAKPLLDKAGVEPDGGITVLGDSFIAAAGKRFYDREPKVRTLA